MSDPTPLAHPAPLRVLHLEDSSLDARLVSQTLVKQNIPAAITRVDKPAEYQRALAELAPDVILADYAVPDFNGLEALRLAQEHQPEVPFIFVSGLMGEEVAVESLKSGATDYVLKNRLDRLAPAVLRAIEDRRLRREREQTEAALHQREAQLRLAMSAARLGDWVHDLDSDRITWGESAYQLFGVAPGGFDGTIKGFLRVVHPDDRVTLLTRISNAIAERAEHEIEFRVLPADGGDERWILGRGQVLCSEDGTPRRVVGIGVDITERKQAEAAFRDADRRKDEFLAVLGTSCATRSRPFATPPPCCRNGPTPTRPRPSWRG